MSNSGDRYGHACQIKRVVSRRIIGPGKSYGKWCLGSITITPVFCYRVTRWPCILGRKTPLEDLLKHVRYARALRRRVVDALVIRIGFVIRCEDGSLMLRPLRMSTRACPFEQQIVIGAFWEDDVRLYQSNLLP